MLNAMPHRIGSVFRWRTSVLGLEAGTICFSYAQLPDGRISVLFSTGTPLSLTAIELNRYADLLGRNTDVIGYRFGGLNELFDDFDAGRFARVFRGIVDTELGIRAG
jgi:hypothetical protein